MKRINLKVKIIVSWMAVLAWIILIFSFSAQPATESNGLSMRITEYIINIFIKNTQSIDDLINIINHLVRKCAHASVYFILAYLILNALKQTGKISFKKIVYTICFCIIYATSDEIHQLFVEGRGCQFTDVLIDSMGAIFGVLTYFIINKYIVKKGKGKYGKNN